MASASLNSNKDQWSDLSIILQFVIINSESIEKEKEKELIIFNKRT
jgi:hypothetical protein